mmetsp:Transcript_9099/g.15604  ORF Transcript_9099/g.15604 Transcript_9099/m.15604 type:complete len:306 (+) Transcript_9099:94-1011(+)
MKFVLIALFVESFAHSKNAVDLTDETSLMQLSLKYDQMSQSKMRPKTEWEEPLTAEEEAVFETDMRMPINQWLQENPSLDSDYFVQWGVNRSYGELMFWDGVHNVSDYVEFGQTGAALWFDLPDYLGEGKGPRTTWSVEGSVITSRHLDAGSYLPDDAYCWTFGWLKGQGLDGTLMSDKSAWEAVAERECQKIGDALSTYLPEDNHTVYRHVMWNRIWPVGLNCNLINGPREPARSADTIDCNVVDCNMLWNGNPSTCKPITKNQMREHAYRKCLFGFAATEVSYCYSRACLLNGNEIGHGSECS